MAKKQKRKNRNSKKQQSPKKTPADSIVNEALPSVADTEGSEVSVENNTISEITDMIQDNDLTESDKTGLLPPVDVSANEASDRSKGTDKDITDEVSSTVLSTPISTTAGDNENDLNDVAEFSKETDSVDMKENPIVMKDNFEDASNGVATTPNEDADIDLNEAPIDHNETIVTLRENGDTDLNDEPIDHNEVLISDINDQPVSSDEDLDKSLNTESCADNMKKSQEVNDATEISKIESINDDLSKEYPLAEEHLGGTDNRDFQTVQEECNPNLRKEIKINEEGLNELNPEPMTEHDAAEKAEEDNHKNEPKSGSDDEFDFIDAHLGSENGDSKNVASPEELLSGKSLSETQNSEMEEDQAIAPPTLPLRQKSTDADDTSVNATIVTNNQPELPNRRAPPPSLPPRDGTEALDVPRTRPMMKNAVPPPLTEEMKSPEFRKNIERLNKESNVNGSHRYSSIADTRRYISSPLSGPQSPLESTAADLNLIANRFRVSSVQIDEVKPSVREDIEAGQNLLKSSYSLIMTHDEEAKENLARDELTEETEEAEWKEISATDWTFWTRVVNDLASVANQESDKLEQEITKGIPRQIRGIIWQLIANSKSKEMEDIYETLLDTESSHEANIRRDLKRTNFIHDDKLESLYRVLKVYSVFDPDVGYTQGMAFITTPLLLNCNTEAEAFGLLISLMKNYHLRDFFLPEMPGLMLMLYQFDRLLEENAPSLASHLTREGIRSTMYATQWFLTVFAYKFPLEFVLRIFDIIFFEGIESILKFAVNLMLKNADELIKLKFDRLLNFLKNELFEYYLKEIMKQSNHGSSLNLSQVQSLKSSSSTKLNMGTSTDNNYNVNSFVFDAMRDIHVTPMSLNRYTAEYDSIHQMEIQKESEYESMRIKNFQLQRESDKLTQDYDMLNEEHINIAKELIQYRLNIETLLDENSDLQSTVENLNKQLNEEIAKQTVANPDASLPIDLRHDLERTKKRNEEVTALNTLLQHKITDLQKNIKELKSVNRTFANPARTKTSPTETSSEPKNPASSSGSGFSSGWSGFKKVFKQK